MTRVMTYIDGFNLYYGLRSKGWKRYYWLNPRQIGVELLEPGQRLVGTRYFTAAVKPDGAGPENCQRQNTYLNAIGCEPDTEIRFGHYLAKQGKCFKCKATWPTYEEKKTDVNISVALLGDAVDDLYDVALLISGDSDLVPPIQAVRLRFPSKRIIVVFPPNRHSNELGKAANASFGLGRKVIADSQFPDAYTRPDGFVLHRPANWADPPTPGEP